MLRTLKAPALILTYILCLFLNCSPTAISAPLRIMALGNSITQSNAANYSYRYNLWKKLIDANLEVDFVGSHAVHFDGNPNWPAYKGQNFDPDNEGHWGWSADQILNGNGDPGQGKLSQWLTGYTPDIVLMHVGTNDMFREQPLDETLNELREIIRLIRGKNPQATILLAKLIPAHDQVAGTNAANNIINFNQQIPALAQELNTTASRVVMVDQYTGFNATIGADTWDGIHPNASGEEKMAQRWFDAIMSVLGTLPVELVSFDGKFVEGKGVELHWKTASETNNAYFEVQRSENTSNFTTIGTEEGAGTTQGQTTYTYLDTNAPTGNVYYRLKQIDLDGSSVYSKVIHVQTSPLSSGLQVYPTRSRGNSLHLALHFPRPYAEAEVFIYAADGKAVEHFKVKSNASGRFEQALNVKHLKSNCLYLVKVMAGEQQLQAKFIIDR
ncbi:GDSL-type esterase/lipase family protein [uncultured Pontibacter sp.]|uniref:GDSL-type esterase/lipase family protein n=1 Tax=uncultured Pontibacter sp. TaxID=453356 RepID=UPI002624163D|nr:GDSL-type esterase/lipase family protein [uncultured Pontibacter sp.]